MPAPDHSSSAAPQNAVQVAVLGSTGSIGRSTLEVIEASGGQFQVAALTAHSSVELLAQQAQRHRPRWIVVTDGENGRQAVIPGLPSGVEVLYGAEGLRRVATEESVDVVVAAIVGSAGLESTWAALEAGKKVALANKETLVVGGPLVMDLARKHGGSLVPVDSEHSAVHQCLAAGRRDEVRRVVLTASGGPFRNYSLQQMENVSVEQALAHPTWEMGPKITVDSATMMNKALEVIEARWLFDLNVEQIGVVVHPQSIVHSLVEYIDGSIIAHLGPPDMKLPIQYALTWPRRTDGIAARLDWSQALDLSFQPPDEERFPALSLGMEVARTGGTAGAVLNAANEAAVAGFLAGDLPFQQIVPTCRSVLEQHDYDSQPTLQRLLQLDAWARQKVTQWIST